MQIKQITISGFKSYTTPVTMYPTSFTAITGLNGTGKSTVLDALLFVLMKTNKLRIKKVEELINSGSTEAFVEIVFEKITEGKEKNSHKDIQHLIVNGCMTLSRMVSKDKSKFIINKQSCTSTFFKQVLSILIPHAHNTVLQGNITRFFSKNIKSIVNETAGIVGFEENSHTTIDVINKKEVKLSASREALQRRISPFVEKLRSERSRFVEQRRCLDEKDRNTDIVAKCSEILECNAVNDILNNVRKMAFQYKKDKKECDDFIEAGKEGTNEMDIFEVRKLFNEKNRIIDLLNKKINNCEDNFMHQENKNTKKLKIEKINREELEREVENLRERELIMSNEMKRRGLEEIGIRKQDARDKVKEIDLMRKLKNDSLCKVNQITLDLRQNIEIITKVINNTISHEKENVDFLAHKNVKSLQIQGMSDELTPIINDIKSLKTINNNSVEILKKAMQKNTVDLNEVDNLSKDLLKKQSNYENALSRCDFPILDGVFGTVSENFQILNPKHKEAIDVILGTRLNYVIVDNEETGTNVIELARKRLNVIPLNKIKSSIDCKKLADAKSYNGIISLDLIAFDKKFKSAFEYLFGGFYIFDSQKDAKKACFELKIFAVSLDGNVYDPRGTVTGGTRKTINSSSVTLKEINNLKKNICDLESRINAFKSREKEIIAVSRVIKILYEYKTLNGEINTLNDKITTLVNLCDNSTDLCSEINCLRAKLDEGMSKLKLIRLEEEAMEQSNKKLEAMNVEYENLKSQKKIIEEELCFISAKLKDNEIRKSKISFYEKDKKREDERIKHLLVSSSKLRKNIIKTLNENKDKLSDINSEKLKLLTPDKIKLIIGESSNADNFFELNYQEGEFIELHDVLMELEGFQSIQKYLSNIYPTLNAEVEDDLKVKLYNARKDLEILNRPMISMNPKNFEFLEKNEELIDLIESRITKLENDKTHILMKIKQLSLESVKQTALALKHLNNAGHFLRYFIKDSDLRIDNDFNLFIKIGNWKDSLTELSGGQKSIVALSLIFTMLNYRPAPFYLFDEIDSALDTSYTQNIGEMIKKEFSCSQFLVVSLKEEFYRNANSVFQVLTNDGRVDIRKIK